MAKLQEATEPKSLCTCGHTGDGPKSQHAGIIGHGDCLARGCQCRKFTWDHWLPYGKRLMIKNARKL